MEGAIARANEICQFVAKDPIATDVEKTLITVSIGVTVTERGVSKVTGLLHTADVAFDRAKNNGRNQVEHSLASCSNV